MRFGKIMLLLIPLVLLLAGCLPQPTLRSEEFLDDVSLVTSDPCGAPCWNGITPGETSWLEALAILQNDAALDGVEIETEEDFVWAHWKGVDSSLECCRMIADSEEENVSFLFLTVSPNMIVDSVLSEYGDPDYVTTFEFTDTESVVQLVYPDLPMVISALVDGTEGSLLANSDVVATLYMAPDVMTEIIESNELKAWEGYQSYGAYAEAEPVITPAVTPEGEESAE